MLLVGAKLFDGTGKPVVEDTAIEVVDGRIGRVGKRADFGRAPAGEILDVAGKFVLPGLINMHEHLIFKYATGSPVTWNARSAPELTIHAVSTAAITLAQGITLSRDMGTAHEVALYMRDAIAAGDVPGPRIIACNRAVRITGGHATLGLEADGADGWRRAARLQLKAGATSSR